MALPTPWRVARSLDVLRAQVDARWPGRSTASDGAVADAAHASTSDHYPHKVAALGAGYFVTARDITNDPDHNVFADLIADALVASRDRRIKYVISHRRIASNPLYSHAAENWAWRDYNESDPHINHFHLSVLDAAWADDTSPWTIVRGSGTSGGTPVSTLDRDDIVNVASAVIQWADQAGALRGDLAGAQYNLRAVAIDLASRIDAVTHAPVEFTAADVANEILSSERFPTILTEAFESALARTRIIVDPAV